MGPDPQDVPVTGATASTQGGLRQAVATVREYMPGGNTLDDEAFGQRHRLLCWVLGLHIPALFAFAVWQGFGLAHSATEMAVPTACLAFARIARHRRLAAFFLTAGLVFCSSVLVHLSGGTIEAHFHFFVLIGLIALYQDWVPFIWNAVFTVLSHGIGGTISPDSMYNHPAAQNSPWVWATIHGVAVLAACIGVVVFWKNTEMVQYRNTNLAADLAVAQTAAAQRQSVSELFVNLARRNQSLLDRQLGLISELEQRERAPEALSDLFQLDHLATRIRRNAESLLVLSGDDPPRRWGTPVPLADVVRAAAAEVEDFRRVEVFVNDHLMVVGRAVADLAHLLAELVENATNFSPPGAVVRVASHLAPGEHSSHLLAVEDVGVGMGPEALQAANALLADPPEVDLRQPRLGLHVVSRLAKRYGIGAQLAGTPGGGLTALVTLPDDLLTERFADPSIGPVSPPAPSPAGVVPAAGQTAPAGANASALSATPPWQQDWHPASPAVLPVAGALPAVPQTASRHALQLRPYVDIKATSPAGSRRTVNVAVPAPPQAASASDQPTTPDGLARRIPGESLAPSLRRSGQAPTSASSLHMPRHGGGAGYDGDRDTDRMRTMLSKFQASQRAGRAAAAEAARPPDAEED